MPRITIWLIALASPFIWWSHAWAEDDTDRLVRLAVRAQLQGKHDQSLDFYTQALSKKTVPAHRKASLYSDRGITYARLGRVKEALDDFNSAIKLYPENPSVYNNRGSVLLGIGQDREAIKDFNRAILLAPGYTAAYLNRGTALLSLKQEGAALLDYNRAVRLEPTNATILNARGSLHLRSLRPHFALRDFTHAINANQRFEGAYTNRARTRLKLGKFAGAVKDFSSAIAFRPQDPKLYHARGRAYLLGGDTEAAIRDFTTAIDKKEASPDSYNARGLARIVLEEYDLAMTDFTRALALDQRSADSYAYRALAYKHTEQLSLAKRDLQTAKRLNAKKANVIWVDGEILESSGETEAARRAYRAALAQDPSFRFARQALERLDEDDAEDVTSGIPVGEPMGDWRVTQQGKSFFARHAKYIRLKVPLEVIGDEPPKLIDWQVRKGAHKRYGVLRFRGGWIGPAKARQVRENVAIIDIFAKKWLAVVPHRQGKRKAAWTWQANKLEIVGTDGIRDSLVIKSITPRSSVAGYRRRRRSVDDRGVPSWAPWARNDNSSRRRTRRSRRRRPRSLFEALFGN